MEPQPFLFRFRSLVPTLPPDGSDFENITFSAEKKLNLTVDGNIAWREASRARRPYTTCGTAGHTIPGGWTPSGKYRPSRYAPSKSDKRSGR